MPQIEVDKSKVNRICRDTLVNFNGSAVHPLELILGLSEAIGRIINGVDCTSIAKQEMVDVCVKHINATIQAYEKIKEQL